MWYVGSSQTRDQTHVPCVGRQILNHWVTRKALHFIWTLELTVHVLSLVNLELAFAHGIYFLYDLFSLYDESVFLTPSILLNNWPFPKASGKVPLHLSSFYFELLEERKQLPPTRSVFSVLYGLSWACSRPNRWTGCCSSLALQQSLSPWVAQRRH